MGVKYYMKCLRPFIKYCFNTKLTLPKPRIKWHFPSLEGCCIPRETEGETARRVQVAQTEIWIIIKRRISNQTQLGFVHRVKWCFNYIKRVHSLCDASWKNASGLHQSWNSPLKNLTSSKYAICPSKNDSHFRTALIISMLCFYNYCHCGGQVWHLRCLAQYYTHYFSVCCLHYCVTKEQTNY